MAGEQLVVRFHTRAGSAFWNKEVAELLNKEHSKQTITARYDQRQMAGQGGMWEAWKKEPHHTLYMQ
eukprot:7587805-Prorocentrum_lima.AAC.1